MFDPKNLDELARRITEALPPGMEQLHQDVRKNVRAAVGAALGRMDLVTREEFDLQAAVLSRTREKLETLELTVAELESALRARRPAQDE